MESKGVCPVCLLPLERIPVAGSRWDTLTGRLVLCSLGMLALVTSLSPALAQVGTPLEFATVPVQAGETITQTQAPPPTLTLLDALKRAERNDPQFRSAMSDAKLAHEDTLQSRVGLLPSLGGSSQYLSAQGNGLIPIGRYVTQDGVHVYQEWGVVRQDLSPTSLMRTDYKRATAAEALSQTKAEKARLALVVTVVKAYYGLAIAQRKYATVQQALDQANRFAALGQSVERGGRKPHSDVVKFQFQQTGQERAFREAKLAMESARLDLSALLFRDFNENFEIVDDLRLAPRVPSFAEVLAMAQVKDPDLRVAIDTVRAARLNVSIAHHAFLPSVNVEVDYGIESNCVGLHCVNVSIEAAGRCHPLATS